MPRKAQNKYVTVGFSPDSEILQKLQRDAEERGLQVGQMIMVRICDWYKGVQPTSSLAAPAATDTNEITNVDEEDSPAAASEIEVSDEQMLANASALLDLDAW